MTAIFLLLRPFLPYLVGALAVFGAYEWAYHKGVDAEKVHTVAAEKKLSDYQQKEREYVASLILGYQKAATETEQAQKEKDDQRDRDFAVVRARASALSRRSNPVANDVVGVLRDASEAAEPARPTAEPKDPAPTDTPVSIGQVTDWGISVLEWARECADRVTGWETYFKKLRDNENNTGE